MAKNYEFYKGRRKKRNYALIPSAIIVGIVALMLVTFYAVQEYAVISKDGIEIRLPLMDEEDPNAEHDALGNEVPSFDAVETELVFDSADYSRVEAVAGENVEPLRAIYISAEEMTEDHIKKCSSRLSEGNALMMEMKPRTGELMWNSSADLAVSYGMTGNANIANSMPRIISELKSENSSIYLVAQISCCIDQNLASRSTSAALRTSYGANYSDDDGTWLDPYNVDVRNYIVQLAEELYALGFDEVVLADVAHPVLEAPEEGEEAETLLYSQDMSTTPGPVTAVCGFALYVADKLADRTGLLSIYCDSRVALAKTDSSNGQDAELFFKVYDRVYHRTDSYTYSYNITDVAGSVTIGDKFDRLVPVVVNYLPDNSSWVYIEQLEEEED